MLPQMMPLPWVMVFFSVFFCSYSVFLFIFYFSYFMTPVPVLLKPCTPSLPW